MAQRVFEIPEILENILIELEGEELPYVTPVNRQFKDAVLGSVKLRQKLALVPEPDAQCHITEITEHIRNLICATVASSSYNPIARPHAPFELEPDEHGITAEV